MKSKPQVTIWFEPIDRHVIAMHAIRHWDMPSNGVFMLVIAAEVNRRSLLREKIAEITALLEQRERTLMAWHGRSWRHRLCDRVVDRSVYDWETFVEDCGD